MTTLKYLRGYAPELLAALELRRHLALDQLRQHGVDVAVRFGGATERRLLAEVGANVRRQQREAEHGVEGGQRAQPPLAGPRLDGAACATSRLQRAPVDL